MYFLWRHIRDILKLRTVLDTDLEKTEEAKQIKQMKAKEMQILDLERVILKVDFACDWLAYISFLLIESGY